MANRKFARSKFQELESKYSVEELKAKLSVIPAQERIKYKGRSNNDFEDCFLTPIDPPCYECKEDLANLTLHEFLTDYAIDHLALVNLDGPELQLSFHGNEERYTELIMFNYGW